MTIIDLLLANGAWSDRVEYGENIKKSNPKYKWQQVHPRTTIYKSFTTRVLMGLLPGI